MAGLDTRGLADGFAQGFSLMDRYQRGQAQQERADQRMDMQRERLDMQRNQADRQRKAAQRQEDLQNVQFTLGKIASGMDVSDEELEVLKRNPKFWPALDPATDSSLQQAEAVVDPEASVDANDPESLAALNQLFGSEINKGPGGEKRVVGMVPGPDGESVTLELEVMGEDGKRYNAPMTEGRAPGGDEDTVMQVPVERLVQQTKGMQTLRKAFQTPQAQQQASKVLNLLRGGESESWELEEHPRLGWVQRNTTTGEIQPVKPGAGSAYEDRGTNYWNRPTATQKDIEYMVANGLAKDRQQAWEKLQQGSGDNSYSRAEDRIEALKDRADHLEKVVRGESATVSSEADITEARAELERLRQQIRQEENQTYDIRVPADEDPKPSRTEKQVRAEQGGAEEPRRRERGVRPGPAAEEGETDQSRQKNGQPSADDILNKYL
ncbi:hypothetical protein [Halomonas elongata]|uniref:hypothetical protein n=1 Tax=Halomonas elongata TaxID=2746 RepID=UPI00186BA6BB|nr:hypothetical protein [Halomonas elongata]MBW5800688.1 hypothetical protein [Halomonas elongata]